MSFEGKDEFIFSYKRLGFERADYDEYKRNGDLEALKGLLWSKAEFDECRVSGDLELKGMGFEKKGDFDELVEGFGPRPSTTRRKQTRRGEAEAAAAEAAVRRRQGWRRGIPRPAVHTNRMDSRSWTR